MTKAKVEGNGAEPQPKAGAMKPGAKRLHLHEVRTTQAKDGSLVHHHTYADSKDAPFPHPERQNMATSSSPEEAGQHVAEMFGQNGMAQPAQAAGEGAGAAAGQAAQEAEPEE